MSVDFKYLEISSHRLAVQAGQHPGRRPASLEHAELPSPAATVALGLQMYLVTQHSRPAGHHDPVLHVVLPGHGEQHGGRGQGEAVHDGEGLGVEDVDRAALRAQHQARHRPSLGVALHTQIFMGLDFQIFLTKYFSADFSNKLFAPTLLSVSMQVTTVCLLRGKILWVSMKA